MLIDHIYLRNYRVYGDELDLDVPPGLVGVYGANGSGKSTLLEAVLWALWGRARTPKEQLRTAGSHGDCVAEVTFEHEGHIYVVRRVVSGAGHMVRASASSDGQVVAEGVRETARYVHSVLGMDDVAFRASVFAEQKQIAAFSDQGPAERRKLVLSLLGVTPLDAARDRARADARQRSLEHDRLRGMLADLSTLAQVAADAAARADALELTADDEAKAAEAAASAASAQSDRFKQLDQVRQEYEKLVVLGQSARAELEAATEQVEALTAELDALSGAGDELARLQPQAARLETAQLSAQLLRAVHEAAQELAAAPQAQAPAPVDDGATEEAARAALAAGAALGSAQAKRELAADQVARARDALDRTSSLSERGDCPLCGQALGRAFAQVQSHRANDLAAAEVLLAEAEKELNEASAEAESAAARHRALSAEAGTARRALAAWQKSASQRDAAAARLARALSALAEAEPSAASGLGPAPSPSTVSRLVGKAEEDLARARRASQDCSRLKGRLERLPQAQLALADARRRAEVATGAVAGLRDKVKGLAFDRQALTVAASALEQATDAARDANRRAQEARVAAASARTAAVSEAQRLADARAQHDQLADLALEAVHLSRAAELLNGFRNTVVGSVGPRLAVQAAELFAELTDNEYDRLEVDADTYGLKIYDAGVAYDLARFSGSEEDLANLAMRVAISEHVRLLSGGTVGLLVLDEIFGPLDDERRARMLQALERLRARFRQILVVTHSTEVKDQLPAAIEVVKQPGRRATARVLGT